MSESTAWMPGDDGARLATRWLRPADPSALRGTVLVRSERAAGSGGPLEKLAHWLAGDGFAVAIQSCRGRGDSEGTFRPFADEVADGGAALRWLAASEGDDADPVVLLGLGYSAHCAWAAAAAMPARVAGIAAGFGARDPYAWLYPGGALQLEAALTLAACCEGRNGLDPARLDLARAGRHLPLDECDRVAARALPAYREWLDHPECDAWWRARTPALPDPARVLVLGGLYDTALWASWSDFEELAERARERGAAPPELLLGPWGAAPPPRPVRRRGVGPLAALARAVSGFASRALGAGPTRDAGTRVFVPGAGWREGPLFPPARVTRLALHLRSGGAANAGGGDGRLAPEPPGDEPADRWVCDPADPVPSLGGASWHGPAGAVDRSAVASRGDVLCYTGEPLPAPLELAGPVALSIHVDAEAPRFDVCARLVAVEPGGAARWLCEGATRRSASDGEATEVALGPAAARLPTGVRLRLEVSGSSLPRFARCGGDAQPPDRRRVHHDAARPSLLRFDAVGDP